MSVFYSVTNYLCLLLSLWCCISYAEESILNNNEDEELVFFLTDQHGAQFECHIKDQSWIENFEQLKAQGCITTADETLHQNTVEVVHEENSKLLTVQEYLAWISAELHLVQMVAYGGLTAYAYWTGDNDYDIGVLGTKAVLAIPGLLQRHHRYLPIRYRKGTETLELFYDSETGTFYSMTEDMHYKQTHFFKGYWLMLLCDVFQHLAKAKSKEQTLLDGTTILSSLGLVFGNVLSYFFSWNGEKIGEKIANGNRDIAPAEEASMQQ